METTIFEYTTIKWYEISKDSHDADRFIASDIFGVLELLDDKQDKIIIINEIHTDPDHRLEGYARKAMIKFAKLHQDRIIAAQAAPLISEYPELLPAYEQYPYILTDYAMFLESVGFRNTNFLHGFENSIGFVYRNKVSKNLLNYVIYKEITGVEL